MLSRPWPRRLTPDRARPWFGDPPPRCLTSCYDRLRQTLRRPLELGLAALVRMMDHVARPTLAEGHVQGVHNQLGSQMVGHRPADDPAAPDIHDDRQIEEARRGRDVDEILSANSSGTCQSSETRYA